MDGMTGWAGWRPSGSEALPGFVLCLAAEAPGGTGFRVLAPGSGAYRRPANGVFDFQLPGVVLLW